jgi:hypothetical protein
MPTYIITIMLQPEPVSVASSKTTPQQQEPWQQPSFAPA